MTTSSRTSGGWPAIRTPTRYLPNSVRRFPPPEALAALMWNVGLRRVRYVLTAGGIIALHVGEVPAPMSTASGVGGGPAVSNVQAVLDAGGAPAARLIARLEVRMAELATGHGELLARYAGDTLSAGGKRLRPLLVFLAAGAPPPETDGLLRAAVAVELVHSATLVHDDVLDGSPLRRGRATVVAAAGRRMATATGDLLLSRAFHELAAGGSLPSVRALSRASTAAGRRRADPAGGRLAGRCPSRAISSAAG